jgi:hypothetical protein
MVPGLTSAIPVGYPGRFARQLKASSLQTATRGTTQSLVGGGHAAPPHVLRMSLSRATKRGARPGPCLVHIPSEPSGSQRSPAVGRSRSLQARSWENRPWGRTLIRMKPEVQVLPGPLAGALTSGDAGQSCTGLGALGVYRIKNSYLVPLLVMARCPALPASHDFESGAVRLNDCHPLDGDR